jgi:hypothetical protein
MAHKADPMKIFCAMSSGAHNLFREDPRTRFTSQLATKSSEDQSVGSLPSSSNRERNILPYFK